MKASTENARSARPASRAAAFAGGVAAALASVALVAAVGIGNATAAPQVAQGNGAGSAVTQAAATCAGRCLQSACTGFQDADGDGICDNFAARQNAQQGAATAADAQPAADAQSAAQTPQSGAAATGACRNDADGDGICDICGSATPANCTGLHHQYGNGNGTGNGYGPGDGTGCGANCGAGHHGNGHHRGC